MVTSNLGTFYYIWYPANWSECVTADSGNTCSVTCPATPHIPPGSWAGRYKPDVGIYNSNDESVMIQHLNWFKQAGIGFVICSWWGSANEKNSDSNLIAFKNLLDSNRNPYPEIKFCIYYEPFANSGTQATIDASVDYIKSNFVVSNHYLKVNNKPVIWVYNNDPNNIATDSERWNNARQNKSIYTVMKKGGTWLSYLNNADSWHQYAPAVRYEICSSGSGIDTIKYSSFVSPGFWRYHCNSRLTRADTLNDNSGWVEFENAISTMKDDGSQWKTIQTFNEWQENSGIEPATLYQHIETSNTDFPRIGNSYGTRYLDIIGKYFGGGEIGGVANWWDGTTCFGSTCIDNKILTIGGGGLLLLLLLSKK